MLVKVTINNQVFEEDSSLTILQVAKKHGIHIPTLCYLKKDESCFEHKPASCRVCVVELKGKNNLVPACATNITDGMEVYTNNARVRNERRTIVELLLSNHPKDCLTCEKSGKCLLQDLAIELGVKEIPFDGPLSQENKTIVSGVIRRNPSKCVLCGRCVAVCNAIQSVGAISASKRGFATVISEPNNCINCGQCIQVCPTGALLQVDDTSKVEKALADESKYVIVHTAPATRVSLGEEFNLAPGTDVTGKMVTALRMVGFKKVFDTNFGADLTIMEEAKELVTRLQTKKNLPLITSCCPGWIKFIEYNYPEFLNLPSTCKSPQEMFSSIAKTYYAEKMGIDPKDMVVVSLMPCVAKKAECAREELKVNGLPATDYSMSVKEFAAMLKRYGIDFANLEDGQYDSTLSDSTGAADIFANTGGVIEAATRTAAKWLNGNNLAKVDFEDVRGLSGTREATVKVTDDLSVKLCVVSGLANARKVLDALKAGTVSYDAIEIMACPGGCVNGGGQPTHKDMEQIDVIRARQAGIYNIDKNKKLRVSCDNPEIKELYEKYLGEPNSHRAHELLHTHFVNRQDD